MPAGLETGCPRISLNLYHNQFHDLMSVARVTAVLLVVRVVTEAGLHRQKTVCQFVFTCS